MNNTWATFHNDVTKIKENLKRNSFPKWGDCLAHDLLIAKLEAYGLDMASLSLLKNYLANRKQGSEAGPLIVTGSNSFAEFPKALN